MRGAEAHCTLELIRYTAKRPTDSQHKIQIFELEENERIFGRILVKIQEKKKKRILPMGREYLKKL